MGLIVLVFFIVLGLSGSSSNSSTSIATSNNQDNQISETNTDSEAKAEVIKTHWSAYTDSINTNWVIITAVIQNTGKTNIKLNEASGTIYDTDGKVIGNRTDSAYPRILAPDEKGYVAIQMMDTVSKDKIADAKVQISFDETDEEPIKLEVINESDKKTRYDYEVVGEIKNTSKEKVEAVRALVLFYDKESNLIDVEVAYPTPEDVSSQETVAFRASTSHLNKSIASYKVIGFSMQWGF